MLVELASCIAGGGKRLTRNEAVFLDLQKVPNFEKGALYYERQQQCM